MNEHAAPNKSITPSATVLINTIASKKKMAGERVYNFAAGDPILTNHACITKRAVAFVEKGEIPYPPVDGVPLLKKLAVDWMNRTSQSEYTEEQILISCGGKFALFAFLYTLLHPQDEVLIPVPYWVSYPEIVRMAGGKPVMVPSTESNNWKLTPSDFKKAISPKSKILIFNNACNPTGVIYNRQEVADILKVAKEHNLAVISDEVYNGLVYDPSGFVSCASFPEYADHTYIIQSCSKNFGMTGWRIGFGFGPAKVIKQTLALQSQTTSGVCSTSQWAAVGALENADEVTLYVKKAMTRRKELFVETFKQLFGVPLDIKSALYAFVPITILGVNPMTNSVSLAEQLIKSDNIAIVPGIAFGVENYVRFAFSEIEEEIYDGLHALRKAIDRMNREKT